MRYGKEHKESTRRRIIESAGRRFKQDGIDGSGIATLMNDAGLTNGAFYAHFASKDDLVATAVAEQLREQAASFRTSRPTTPASSSFSAATCRSSTATTRRRLPVGRAARRDRALHRWDQAGLHRRPAGRHRHRRRAPGDTRSRVGSGTGAQRIRHDGRDLQPPAPWPTGSSPMRSSSRAPRTPSRC